MVEFAKSFNLLGRLTGDPVYADRIEDIMLNHFPASHTPDLKALHYLTASNQPQLDSSENHDYRNKRRQIDYSPHLYRCCQHNAAMGWPWYVQHLWQATSDNGLAAWTYAPSEVSAVVGDGTEVTLVADTEYPFETTVDITVRAPKATEFPLYFRVPRWCDGFSVAVNGRTGGAEAPAGSFVRIRREWFDGDAIHIEMPVQLSSTRWPRNGSMTVDRGPLSYSVRIAEEWKRCGGTDEWPEWEVLPKSPWNYGLVARDGSPEIGSVEVNPTPLQPWTVESAPIVITASAKRIPGWRIGEDQTVETVPESPDASGEPIEEIALIPLGCARLRMSCLPVVS